MTEIKRPKEGQRVTAIARILTHNGSHVRDDSKPVEGIYAGHCTLVNENKNYIYPMIYPNYWRYSHDFEVWKIFEGIDDFVVLEPVPNPVYALPKDVTILEDK